MATGPRYKVEYRRKREGKTNYKQRLNLLKSEKPRLVVRKSNKYILAQVIEYNPNGDKVISTTRSDELKKFNWNFSMKNTPAAYLTGLLCGYKSKAKKVNSAIVDIGLQSSTKGSRLYAVVKGAVDAGLLVPVNKEIFPSDDRINGKIIFGYIKNDAITKKFDETKSLIEKKFVSKENG